MTNCEGIGLTATRDESELTREIGLAMPSHFVNPTSGQIAAAVEAVRRAHHSYGYRRPMPERYAEIVIWAALTAIHLHGHGEKEK